MKNYNPLQVLSIILFCICLMVNSTILSAQDHSKSSFYTNESFIKGFDNPLDLLDSLSVFRYVFGNLDDEVTMYPSENYYYFRFTASGKSMWGSLSLSAHSRDKGILGFGYIEKQDRYTGENYDAVGGGKEFSREDGVIVEKINPFRYSATFEGKTVFFNFNLLSLDVPGKARLRNDEVFVGPNFDESGMKFYLIFNSREKHLFWILNEDGNLAETFNFINNYVVVGERTGFAFYLDTINNRKILVGIDAYNALLNNWYDGPFDQLPDNYVYTGQLELKKYIEAAYYLDTGSIDKYGNYTYEEGARVAVAPYYAYYSVDDLIEKLETCMQIPDTSAAFYSCLTEQIFFPPE